MALDTAMVTTMISGDEKSNNQTGDIDLNAIWGIIRGAPYWIVAATILGGILAGIIAFTVTPTFRAETVITTARSSGFGSSGGMANQLGGLANIASLAGVNLDSGSGAEREAKAILQSRSLVEEFIKKNDLLPVLVPNAKKPPSLWLAVKEFREGVITIKEDKRMGLTTIAIDWKDGAVAAQWANGFVALANERIRARAISEATRNIAFLNKQIPQTSVVEVQHTLYNLIENETKTLMLADARAEYAFTSVDPAVKPERKISPRRSLYVLSGAILGFAIGLSAAYLRSRRRGTIGSNST